MILLDPKNLDRAYPDARSSEIMHKTVEFFEGNYAEYEADLHRRKGADADQPHRMKFKPLRR